LKALLPLVTFVSLIASLLMLQKIGDRCSLSRASRRANQLILAATAAAFFKLL
jgi:hypothetical protein